jgi:tight adherence protein C
MELLIPVLVFVSVSLVVLAFLPGRSPRLQERLGAYQYTGPLSARDAQLERPLISRVGWPLVEKLVSWPARLAPQRAYDEARQLMMKADRPMDLNLFMGLRAAGMLALPLLYVLVTGVPTSLVSFALMGLLGWFGGRLPVNWLRRQAAARQKRIQRALPDTLDLITVSVEAGLGLEAALAKVVEKTRGPLRDEIGRTLQEITLGKMRRLAMRDMAARCDVPDLTSFVTAIVQAEQMGLGIASVLRNQSDELRLRRRQRAEETAEKAPIKMLFPLVMFILPALMIVIIGPAAWSIYVNLISSNALGGM